MENPNAHSDQDSCNITDHCKNRDKSNGAMGTNDNYLHADARHEFRDGEDKSKH